MDEDLLQKYPTLRRQTKAGVRPRNEIWTKENLVAGKFGNESKLIQAKIINNMKNIFGDPEAKTAT